MTGLFFSVFAGIYMLNLVDAIMSFSFFPLFVAPIPLHLVPESMF